ncbi:MAG: hypothetical protein ACYTF8_17180, partial [Planctomycetota bacterium]
MKTEDALGRILDGFQRLEKRLQEIEGRLHEDGEESPAKTPAPADPAPVQQRDDGEEREDPFAPEVRRASQTRHQSAVNKALSMLGLVPDVAEEKEERKEQSAKHQAAIQKALTVLRVGAPPPEEEDAEQAKEQSAKHQAAIGKALHVLGKAPPPEEEDAEQLKQQSAKHQAALGKALHALGKAPPPADLTQDVALPQADEPPEQPPEVTAEEPSEETAEIPPEELKAGAVVAPSVDDLEDETPAEALAEALAEAADESLIEAFDEPRDETSSAVIAEALDKAADEDETSDAMADEVSADAIEELTDEELDETSDETSIEALNEALELKEDEADEILTAKVLDEVAAQVEAESATIPLPDLDFLDAAPGDGAHGDMTPAVDLDTALDIDLERPRAGARDYAVAILNALVLLGAAAAALYAAGIFRADGIAQESWREIGVGSAAVLTGAFALFALNLSIHLRAALAGASALLLHALLLMLLAPRMPLD